jgi:hypothetical protein
VHDNTDAQYFGSGMFIPDPDFPIPDLVSRIQKQEKRGGKNEFCFLIFYVAINCKNGAEKNLL